MMKFTSNSLRLTADQFRRALRDEKIPIRWEPSFNLWSQIITQKNYSAAYSQAEHEGGIHAVPVEIDRIVWLFKERNRYIDEAAAVRIFMNSTRECLIDISSSMHQLWRYVRSRPGCCVDNLSGGQVGIFEEDKPGYLRIDGLFAANELVDELIWIRSSAALTADVINELAGVSSEIKWDIVSSSLREGFQKNESVFVSYFGSCVEEFSNILAERVIRHWPDPDEWERLDYDTVSYIVFDVIEEFCISGRPQFNGWLKADCNIGDALLDHVAARIREGLRVFDENPDGARDWLAGVIEFATKKIIR